MIETVDADPDFGRVVGRIERNRINAEACDTLNDAGILCALVVGIRTDYWRSPNRSS